MPLDFIGNVIGSGISAAASYANTKQVNETNLKIARETNLANRQMVEEQNKAAAAESEKAYNRSKAANQVGLMMSAGMSRAAAINALNGGGSYTPAPVNTSQDSAPQMQTADLSALANIGQGLAAISQRKHEEKMSKMQIAAQKEENAANRQNAKEIAEISADASKYSADSSAGTARERLAFDKEKWNDEVKVLRSQVRNIDANTSLTKEQKQQLIELKPYLKDNAIQEVEKLKQEVESIKSIRDLETKRFALERLKIRLESYFGVSISHMRNTLQYWEEKPETLYKGFNWRQGQLKELNAREEDLMNYLEELNEILDSLD